MNEENKKKEDQKSSKMLDKLLMGAVIGGAIGSVIGATIAPQKGKETRREIADAVASGGKHSLKFFGKIKKLFSFKKKDSDKFFPTRQESSPLKKIPNENSSTVEKNP